MMLVVSASYFRKVNYKCPWALPREICSHELAAWSCLYIRSHGVKLICDCKGLTHLPPVLPPDLNHHDLVSLALLLGCDYCPQGVPGVGREKSLKLISACKSSDQSCDMLERFRMWKDAGEGGLVVCR